MNADNPQDKHASKIIDLTSGNGSAKGFAGAIKGIIADQGTERDWRNTITVPRPRTWDERPELIGQTVIPHSCCAREHGDNPGCICNLIGKPVVIIKIYDTQFVGTPSYHIEGSDKRVQEREFANETKDQDPDMVKGFILENSEHKFLTAGFVWMPAENVLSGYLHNAKIVYDLLSADVWPNGRPAIAHPASSKLDGSEKQLLTDLATIHFT